MSLTQETVSMSSSNISYDPEEGISSFVMIPKSQSLSPDIEVPRESIEQKDISDSQSNVLPTGASVENSAENEVFNKMVHLAKENEELRITLKHNNVTLQKHINDFAEMQAQYKRTNETVKKEHQKAKAVVTNLRNENRSLKEQLNSLQLQNEEISQKEKEVGLYQENMFLKQQVNFLQEQIAHIAKEIKDHQFTEAAVESWQQFVGSIASYEYQAGMLSTGIEKHRGQDTSSLEDRYANLETEKEILKVDFDKMKVEMNHMEEQLLGLLEEQKRLQTNFVHVNEEKEELLKILNDRYNNDAESENETQKLEEMVSSLKTKVHSLNEKLQTETQRLSKTEEEKRETTKKYHAQITMMEELKQRQRKLEMDNVKNVSQDEEDDSVSKEKYDGVKMLYLKYEGEVVKVEAEINRLQDQLRSLGKEKYQLQEELKKDKEMAEMKLLESRQAMQNELESRSETYREKLNQLHSELEEGRNREEHHQGQLENLQSELEEGKQRVMVLQTKLEASQSILEERGSTEESLQDQVCHLIQENDSMTIKIEKLTELNSRRDALYEDREREMRKEFNRKDMEKSSILEMLKSQLGSSKEESKRYQEQREGFKMEHERLATQHDSLMKEYDELLNSFNGTLEENRNKRSDTTAEIEHFKRQMDYFTAERSCYDEAMLKKSHQMSEMQEKLQELQGYNDHVPVLEQQLEVFRNDFQVERAARERQHADLLQHREEIERLRMANEELQREVDNNTNDQMAEMQRRHGSHVPHNPMIHEQTFRNSFFRRGADPDPSESSEHVGQGRYAEQPEEPYPCHGCRHNFARFSDLEAHVRDCPAALHGNGPPHPGVGNSQPSCPKCGNEFPDLDTLQIHVLECLDS